MEWNAAYLAPVCVTGMGAFGLLMLFAAARTDAHRLRTWTRVTGRILEAKAKKVHQDEERSILYALRITYEYTTLEGQTLTGAKLRTIDEGYQTSHRPELTRIVETLPPDTLVEIVYDPKKPTECMLRQPLVPKRVQRIFAAIAVALILGGLIWFDAVRK